MTKTPTANSLPVSRDQQAARSAVIEPDDHDASKDQDESLEAEICESDGQVGERPSFFMQEEWDVENREWERRHRARLEGAVSILKSVLQESRPADLFGPIEEQDQQHKLWQQVVFAYENGIVRPGSTV